MRTVRFGSVIRRTTASVAAVAVAAVLALVAAAPPAAADDPDPLLAQCTSMGSPRVSGEVGTPYRVVLADGLTFTLDAIPTAWWQGRLGGDAVRNLYFYAQSWLWASYTRAQALGDTAAVESVLALAARSVALYPDNRHWYDPQWNEGANGWRERTLTCLYLATHDPRLVPAIEATAAANLDAARYYGPPGHPVHNHGLMASAVLLMSGMVLDRAGWRRAALSRMAVSARGWITPAGLTIEQSVGYQQVNMNLWIQVSPLLDRLTDPGAADVAGLARTSLARARAAQNFLLAPDAQPVVLGDITGPRRTVVPQPRRLLVDPVAGIATMRWSWTTPDDFYAVRFGPRRTAHGHYDHGSVVWWARGRPVLVDPGNAAYSGAALTWQRSALAHSVAVPHRATFRPAGTAQLVRLRGSSAHQLTIRSSLWSVPQTRVLTVDAAHDLLRSTDTTTRGQSQVWQLDPRWQLRAIGADRHSAVFRDSTGGVLTLSTTGLVASVKRGQPGFAGGWVFHERLPGVPAARVVVTGSTTLTTTFRVAGPPQTPWRA